MCFATLCNDVAVDFRMLQVTPCSAWSYMEWIISTAQVGQPVFVCCTATQCQHYGIVRAVDGNKVAYDAMPVNNDQ
jgi:hypothetical protein